MQVAEERKSAQDQIEAMMLHVIESQVREAPHIAVVSKKQLWFGEGVLFKDCPDPDVKDGLRKFLGVRIPTDVEVESKNLFYGYPALQKPWSYLNNITNPAIRQRISWRTIDGKELSDIRIVLGKGYIRKDGTLDPKQTKGISCYVLFFADSKMRPMQNQWISEQELWIRLQILRNQVTHRELLTEQKKRGSNIVRNNNKLLDHNEYLQLDPQLDREQITWDDYAVS